MTIEIVATDLAPRPNGHYSQAVVHGGLVYVSLQLPFSPEDHSMPEGVDLQMEQLLLRRTLSPLLQCTHQIVDRRISHNAVAVGRVVAVARVELLQKHANGIGSIRRSTLQKEVRRIDFHHGGCGRMVVDKLGRGVGNQTVVLGGQTEHGDVHLGEGSADVAL